MGLSEVRLGEEAIFLTFLGSWPGGYTGTTGGGAKVPPGGTTGCMTAMLLDADGQTTSEAASSRMR